MMKKRNVFLYIQINAIFFKIAFLSFGYNVISFSTTAKNLGFHFTDGMRIDAHVQDICHKVYIDIRRITSIRHLLSILATNLLTYLDSLSNMCLVCQAFKIPDLKQVALLGSMQVRDIIVLIKAAICHPFPFNR